MNTFQAGKTYIGRFIGDADAIISLTVLKRTASTITAESDIFRNGVTVKTLRIKPSYDGISEYVLPLGSYSMAPAISAEQAEPIPVPEVCESDFGAFEQACAEMA